MGRVQAFSQFFRNFGKKRLHNGLFPCGLWGKNDREFRHGFVHITEARQVVSSGEVFFFRGFLASSCLVVLVFSIF